MSRSLSRVQSWFLGLVLVLAAVLAGWGFYQIGSRRGLFDDTLELRAGFHEVHGIERGAPVRFRGIEAGHVTAIDLPSHDPDQKIIVRFRVKRQFQPLLARDSRLRVMNDGMFGSKILNIEPGTPTGNVLVDGDEISVVETKPLSEVLAEASRTLSDIREGQGTLAKLLSSDEIHSEMLKLVRQMQEMVAAAREGLERTRGALQEGKEAFAALKQDAEAIRRMPIVRSYVEDAVAILYRPDQVRDRRVFNSSDLFEPNTSVLTESGRAHLNNLASWLGNDKSSDSEIVVVSYLDPELKNFPPAAGQLLTLKRSETVVTYLRETLKVHRTGWLSSRKMISLGMGQASPPIPENESLPPERTEIVLFRPRS
jgi:outer membrane protein OmpA-like peptidoglycan-associated protein